MRRKDLVLGILAGICLILAWNPGSRGNWALENALVLPFAAVLLLRRNRLPLSVRSYALISAFLALHEVGAHFTYSRVPYDAWASALWGHSLSEAFGWTRNHYDRFVHAAFGALLVLPAREALEAGIGLKARWASWLAFQAILAASAAYELLEWGVATVFRGDIGTHYLGMQGDMWDGNKDVAMAVLGALLALGLSAACQLATPPSRASVENAS